MPNQQYGRNTFLKLHFYSLIVCEANTVSSFHAITGLGNLCISVLVEDAGLYQNNGANVRAIRYICELLLCGFSGEKYNGTNKLPPLVGLVLKMVQNMGNQGCMHQGSTQKKKKKCLEDKCHAVNFVGHSSNRVSHSLQNEICFASLTHFSDPFRLNSHWCYKYKQNSINKNGRPLLRHYSRIKVLKRGGGQISFSPKG